MSYLTPNATADCMNDVNQITQHCTSCIPVSAEEEDCDATPPNFYVAVNDNKGLEFVSNDTIVLLHILLNV